MRNLARTFALCFSILFAQNTNAADPSPLPLKLPSDAPNLAVLYETLARQIRRGNVVLYIVPFATSGNEVKTDAKWWMVCNTMPQVNAIGQAQAKAIHQSLLLFGAPIGLVWSSEVCPSMTSASFVAGSLTKKVLATADLNPIELQRLDGVWDGVIHERIRSKFLTVIEGKNNVLSGHKLTLETAPHPALTSLEAGDSALFTVNADESLNLLARLTWNHWKEMHDYILRQALRQKKAKKK